MFTFFTSMETSAANDPEYFSIAGDQKALTAHMSASIIQVSIVLNAWKDDMNVIPDVGIIIEHEDNYYSTAVVFFLVIMEYFSGSFQDVTGVHFMGHILNPDFLQKLPEY
ncbi:MAG: hypothetical protein JXJ04_21245 [Spirochaetales bacterium]|nr:hypothetical protein [Spirochaetales bacterium]